MYSEEVFKLILGKNSRSTPYTYEICHRVWHFNNIITDLKAKFTDLAIVKTTKISHCFSHCVSYTSDLPAIKTWV